MINKCKAVLKKQQTCYQEFEAFVLKIIVQSGKELVIIKVCV